MSFREKSAWLMLAVMVGTGLYYLSFVPGTAGAAAPPVEALAAYVVLIVIASVVAQIVLGITDPKGADAPADERERPIIAKAGNWSGLVLGTGAVASLLGFLAHGDGNLLFHSVMGSLIVSSIAEYGFQIALMRRA